MGRLCKDNAQWSHLETFIWLITFVTKAMDLSKKNGTGYKIYNTIEYINPSANRYKEKLNAKKIELVLNRRSSKN
jgi:hypothetical protein